MPIVNTNLAAEFDGDTLADIYAILLTGTEWAPYLRKLTGVTKPRQLPYADGSEYVLQSPVDCPRIGTNDAYVDIALDRRQLEVEEMMFFDSINPDDWRGDFPDFQPSGDMLNLTLDPEVARVVMAIIQNRIDHQLSILDYQGDTDSLTSGTLVTGEEYIIDTFVAGDDFTNIGGTNVTDNIFTATGTTPTTWTNGSSLSLHAKGFYDGFKEKMVADADVVDVANVGVITTSNVFTILNSVIAAIPVSIRSRAADIKIFMSYTDMDKYDQADGATQQFTTDSRVSPNRKYKNLYELVPMESIPENEIMCTIATMGNDGNLVSGAWFENDSSNFQMYKESSGDKDWAILFRFLRGVEYRSGQHIVYYAGS